MVESVACEIGGPEESSSKEPEDKGRVETWSVSTWPTEDPQKDTIVECKRSGLHSV